MAEFDSVIPAGGSGKLVAKIRTRATDAHTLNKTIAVTTDCAEVPSLRLLVSLEPVTPISVKPQPRVVLHPLQGEEQTMRMLLHRTDGKPLEVTSIEIQGPEGFVVTQKPAKAGESELPDIKAVAGDVWVDVKNLPQPTRMTRSAAALLTTNDPQMPKVTIPLTVVVRQSIEATPIRNRLWLYGGGGHGTQSTVTLNHLAGKEFEIKKLVVSHPDLFEVSQVTSGKSARHELVLKIKDGVDRDAVRSMIRGTVTVTTSDPMVPELEVTVFLSERSGFRRTNPGQAQRVGPRVTVQTPEPPPPRQPDEQEH